MPADSPDRKNALSDIDSFVLRCCANGIHSARELHFFIEAISGHKIPYVAICPNHQSPWDYIAPAYFDKLGDAVIIAARDGGKTLDTALLNAVELLTKPKVEISSLGAIESQAKKCFAYTDSFVSDNRVARQFVADKTLSRIIMLNRANYTQIVGTLSGVNSPHPNYVRADEVELMKPKVVEEMTMMPHSSNGYKGSLTYISSRKYAHGNMQSLVTRASATKKQAVVTWCYKEIAEPCPEERRGRGKKIYETQDLSNADRFHKFVAWEKCGECPLLSSCRGELAYATGFKTIDDLIREFSSMDKQTWVAQKECGAPSLSDLVYPQFRDEAPWVGNYKYNPALKTFIGVDFGYVDSCVFAWIQEKKHGSNPAEYFVVKEYVTTKTQLSENIEQVKIINQELGCKPYIYVADSADPAACDQLEAEGFPVEPIKKTKVAQSIPLVRAKLLTASGNVYLHIDEECEFTRNEFQRYHYPECGGEQPEDEFNHSLDAIRYVFMYLNQADEPVFVGL